MTRLQFLPSPRSPLSGPAGRVAGRARALVGGAILATAIAGAPEAARADGVRPYPGPFLAEVVRVIDGDTVEVRAHIWPEQTVTTAVRLADIDTPELRGRCPSEEAAARRARDHVRTFVTRAGGRLWLRDVRLGKYAGRVLGSLWTEQGEDLGRSLIGAGLAVPYDQRRAQRVRLCGRD